MGIKLVKGKTYLFDNRNGNIHPFEPLLAGMNYMVAFTAEKGMKLPPLATEVPGAYSELSAVDKANEWDRLARLPKAKREAEEAKKRAAAALVVEPAQPEVEDESEGEEEEDATADPVTLASVPKPPPPPATE